MRLEDDIIEDIRSDIERAERVDRDLDLTDCTPDFAYPLASVAQAGRTLEDCRLLFIVVVKGTPINNVGSELFAQANTSAMYPNSHGMICMETKLIFVYLKMPKEHRNLTFPLRTEGKIHYT
uniref:Uncharacterized protein n=1 Tax=Magallana gigas TaxID=29159 RepID=A0A8W8LTL8_MAGGI